MIQYTQITAEGKIYNIPEFILCQTCNQKAYRDSDVEPDSNNEDKYIAYYQCQNRHMIRAFVALRE